MDLEKIKNEVQINNKLLIEYDGYQDVTKDLVEIFVFVKENQIQLEQIQLVGLIFDDIEIINQILEIAQNLKYLGLEQCLCIKQTQFEKLFQGNFMNLKTLNLSQCRISDKNLEALSKNEQMTQNLEKIQVSFCKNITDLGLKFIIDNFKNLTDWDLKGANITDEIFEYFLNSPNANLQIKYLNLCKCTLITGNGLENLLVNGCEKQLLQNLWFLDIACTNINDQGAVAITHVNKSLRKLKIYECDYVSKRAFIQLFQKQENCQNENQENFFQNLQEIDFSWSNFSGEALNLLIEHNIIKQLTQFIIPRCKYMDYEDFDMLAELPFENLQVLNIGFNQNKIENLVRKIQERKNVPKLTLFEAFNLDINQQQKNQLIQNYQNKNILFLI
ncbi:hypothetical protein PPERSA_02819 [Pseudocohnilembus persalinus]|uniref:F-box/LRR-repeat protein 15-like leucin rich repeat domain-containing protein n=1 Tax=Pseudocohnilembus persalinus TaxID=266149 RepID=A0A0V0QNA0_PSEPJ|nr:hypothetical protein PPERSA_02819 [Pseudocohnilembus persalinus]|eukprot:KRX03440.1 hypothetical protein PPERSA_02819 [Pseudocohnilembus persalinus]